MNSIFTGDKLLTTGDSADAAMFARLGLRKAQRRDLASKIRHLVDLQKLGETTWLLSLLQAKS